MSAFYPTDPTIVEATPWVGFGAKHKVAALQPAARGNRREAGSQLRGRP